MSAESIRALIADCRKAATPTPEMGEATRTTLGALGARLNVIVQEVEAAADNATVIQSAHWEVQLKEIQALLLAIQRIGNEGPTDPGHEMYKDYASNARIYGIGIWAMVLTIAMIGLTVCFAYANPNAKNGLCGRPSEVAGALPLVAVMGALGGFLTCIQSFGRYVGNRQFLRSWTRYYFLFPLKGAGLAIIVFFLTHTGIGTPPDLGLPQAATRQITAPPLQTTNIFTGATGQSVTNVATNMPVTRVEVVSQSPTPSPPEKLNLVVACLIAALTGMFANQAIEMLASVFAVLFKKVEGKDTYQDNKPPTGAKPAGK